MGDSPFSDILPSDNVDFVMPEQAPGQDAAGFSMAAQR